MVAPNERVTMRPAREIRRGLFFTAMNANRPKARNDASTAAIIGGFGYF